MIRIGIVGCGRILAAHLRGYRLLREAGVDDFRITALCARREEDALGYVRRGHGPAQRPAVSNIPGDPLAIGDEYLSDFQPDTPVEVYTDYRQMVARAPIDAVNDFTTHSLHHQVAAAALDGGKHLLSQKPLAVSMAAARQMCDRAEAGDRVFGVFENFRFAPATRHLRWLFEADQAAGSFCGALQMVLMGYVGVWWAPRLIVAETPWRHVRDEGGGISLDLGVHFFDQVRHVAGEIRHVTAQTAIVEPRRAMLDRQGRVVHEMDCDADDTVFASFDTERGVAGQLSASWAGCGGAALWNIDARNTDSGGGGTIYYGSQGRVTGDHVVLADGSHRSLAALYRQHAPAQRQAQEFPFGLDDSFALAQHDWLDAIRQRREPLTSGREGMRDLAAAFALIESATAGRRVTLDEVLSGTLREYQRPIDARFGLA
ncbi:MAG: Gfo/Idh/MocA family oxidoreductase [Planctomycetes bacterium]|nr:Gfo/Idh/MocA family oxidoreductase [Planctomycetota bacterium]